jgi:hypothetical protein
MERPAGSTGYLVVLVGVAAFVAGLFLPYYDYDIAPVGSAPFYRLTTLGRGELATSVGGVLFLFAGVATLVGVGIAGVRGSGGWTRSALAAVAIAWSLTWIGVLLGAPMVTTRRLMGYWILWLGVVVVLLGTVLVWVFARADVAKVDGSAR